MGHHKMFYLHFVVGQTTLSNSQFEAARLRGCEAARLRGQTQAVRESWSAYVGRLYPDLVSLDKCPWLGRVQPPLTWNGWRQRTLLLTSGGFSSGLWSKSISARGRRPSSSCPGHNIFLWQFDRSSSYICLHLRKLFWPATVKLNTRFLYVFRTTFRPLAGEDGFFNFSWGLVTVLLLCSNSVLRGTFLMKTRQDKKEHCFHYNTNAPQR